MKTFKIAISAEYIEYYEVEADTEEAAREAVESGEYQPDETDTVNYSIFSVDEVNYE